jgi:hypothetical protein
MSTPLRHIVPHEAQGPSEPPSFIKQTVTILVCRREMGAGGDQGDKAGNACQHGGKGRGVVALAALTAMNAPLRSAAGTTARGSLEHPCIDTSHSMVGEAWSQGLQGDEGRACVQSGMGGGTMSTAGVDGTAASPKPAVPSSGVAPKPSGGDSARP